MTDFRKLPDLADRALGGAVLAANDESFAAKENLVASAAPAPRAEFGHKGKEYDGWETRRRRSPGYDWAHVALADAGDRTRSGPLDGRGLGDPPPPRGGQRLGGARAGLRGRGHARRAGHDVVPRQLTRHRRGHRAHRRRRGGPAAAHPAATRHPAP